MKALQTLMAVTESAKQKFEEVVPTPVRETAILRGFSFLKIPLIFFCQPSVVELTDSKVEVRIPLNRRTRNHLKSMYFGTLCVGADCAGGLIAMRQIQKERANVGLVFKDFQAEFLKRPEGDVHFTCEQGEEIHALVKKAMSSAERENLPVRIIATVPKVSGDEPVAKFTLTLSLKRRA